ncbi:rho guanine nucleotide exchange factor 10-like [Polyodon spathula]|uniref:rho guanine nucleotide exchange factor 10-like n=1 Tax=Polyodon spathula TaxID=7913 RepID=UPI001B7E19B3|nr:rho guanine nucleotide exchange factor 10-like [Polyodon spathula]
MDVEEFPPPPPEVIQSDLSFADEEGGELFEFDDSGYEIPEADRQPPAPPLPDYEIEMKDKDIDSAEDKHKDAQGHLLSNTQKKTLTNDVFTKTEDSSFTTGSISEAPLQRQSPVQEEKEDGQEDAASARVLSGYSVPVPNEYAVPSDIPLILPAYSTPVIIRHLSVDEEVTVQGKPWVVPPFDCSPGNTDSIDFHH